MTMVRLLNIRIEPYVEQVLTVIAWSKPYSLLTNQTADLNIVNSRSLIQNLNGLLTVKQV